MALAPSRHLTRAAPPVPPPGMGDGARDPDVEDSLDVVRELRAEIQGLRDVLRRVRDGKATVASSATYINERRAEVKEIFARMRRPEFREAVADHDEVRHLANVWSELAALPLIALPEQPLTPDEQTSQLALSDDLCHELVTRAAEKTIPARLNDWLRQDAWVGYRMSFHDLFSDELPDAGDRDRLLRVLSTAPGVVVGGMVDPATGLVYPYHPKRWMRNLVVGSLAVLYVLVTAGILAASPLLPNPPTGAIQTDLLVGWLLLTAGALTHVVVDFSKREGGVASLPIGHLATAIDARSGVILLKLLLMAFAYVGLIFLTDQPARRLDAFLVGYSLDSFVGIFSAALDRRAADRGAAITKSSGN